MQVGIRAVDNLTLAYQRRVIMPMRSCLRLVIMLYTGTDPTGMVWPLVILNVVGSQQRVAFDVRRT